MPASDSVTEAVAAASEPLVEAAATVAAPVAEAVTTVSAPLAEAVTTLSEPLAEAASAVTAPVAAAVSTVSQPLTEAVAAASEPLVEAAATVAAPVAEAVASVGQPVADAVTSISEPLANAAATAGGPVTDVVVGAAQPLGAALGAGAASVVTGAGTAASALGTAGSAVTDAVAAVADGAAAASAGVAPAAAEAAAYAVGSSSLAESLVELIDAEALLEAAAAQPNLVLTAGLLALAGITVSSAGRGPALSGCAANARLAFTNVRVLPCLAARSLDDYVSKATAMAAWVGAHATPAPLQRGSGLPAERRRSAKGRDLSDVGVLFELRGALSDRAAAFRRNEEGEDDARLIAQIGIVLATVYASFLTAWFWATRLRWNPRS